MAKDYEPTFLANTSYWIPTIIKVENGWIMQIQSPSQPTKETYVFSSYADLLARLRKIFGEEE